MKIDYIGKCLLLKLESKKILVIGDLHLGFQDALKRSGFMMPGNIYSYIKKDLIEVLNFVGNIDMAVLLGDVKHEFGMVSYGERTELSDFVDNLMKRCKRVVIIKGNHDVLLDYMKNEKTEIKDYFVYENICFIHGNKDFEVMHEKKIDYWIMGHAHPAVNLREGNKTEKYKCFLVGKYNRKNVIVMPSFFSVNEGTDPREFESDLAWPFNLSNFDVKIVEGLEVFDFGKLSKIN